jgi:hypothetical protein
MRILSHEPFALGNKIELHGQSLGEGQDDENYQT